MNDINNITIIEQLINDIQQSLLNVIITTEKEDTNNNNDNIITTTIEESIIINNAPEKKFINILTLIESTNQNNQIKQSLLERLYKKRKSAIKELYNRILQYDPSIKDKKLPIIGKLTEKKLEKLLYDNNYRARVLKELGFPVNLLNTKQQIDIIQKILQGKLSLKEGLLLITNELQQFFKYISNNIESYNFKELLKKFGAITIISIIVIGLIGLILFKILPAILLALQIPNTIALILSTTTEAIIFSLTINFIAKIYTYIFSKHNLSIFGYTAILTTLISSIILVKIHSLLLLCLFIITIAIYIIWQVEMIVSTKIEIVYAKLGLDKYRKKTVYNILKLNLMTRLIIFILERFEQWFGVKLVDKLINLIITIEDISESIIDKIVKLFENIIDTIYSRAIHKLVSYFISNPSFNQNK